MAAVLAGAASAAALAADYSVAVTGGAIRGRSYGNGAVFAGVPFAAPPVGPLRWRPPAPVIPWTGVRDATSPSMDCLQPDDGAWNRPMIARSSEDCLYLNVVSPEWPAKGPHPVIVFIHGGGNFAGGAWEHLAKGVTLQRQGIVLVTVNYRLGIFGFFAHPGLTAESPDHASGNYALQDLIASLHWVAGNIAAFGGDPGNVTLMGQSAGALDICLLMASPGARGLFHKAIVESAPGVGPPAIASLAQGESEGARFASDNGWGDIEALRRVPGTALLAAAEKTRMRGRVVLDGLVLRENPATLFATEREARIPVLIGTNARETTFAGDLPALVRLVSERYPANPERALRLYGLAGPAQEPDPVFGDARAQYMTDTVFRLPTFLVADWHAQAGLPVWMYLFSRTPRGREATGASHSLELSYVFGEMDSPPDGALFGPEDRRISSEIQRRWSRFAASGNPGVGKQDWARYDDAGRAYLDFCDGGPILRRHLRDDCFQMYREDYVAHLPAPAQATP